MARFPGRKLLSQAGAKEGISKSSAALKTVRWKTALLCLAGVITAGHVLAREEVTLPQFLALLDPTERRATFQRLEKDWQPGLAAPLIEAAALVEDTELDPGVYRLLEKKTGQKLGRNTNAWYRWLWETDPPLPAWYSDFKATWYAGIDPRFEEYFRDRPKTNIRLDEVRWGGVRRDGIPPLDHPKMLTANQAGYLAETDVIFGVSVNGEARAYPKRILAWHEMVRDKIAGQEFNGVYCTLCGSMILYRTKIAGKHYELGTSGFLYRSNKLIYDQETKSLWSTLEGEPVVGSLVGRGLKLEPLSVVTTTWGEWKERHPETEVLSLATGFERDYSEGAAYHDYFATDDLMFIVPGSDQRLKNKAEVLALRFGTRGAPPLAIAQQLLSKHPIYQGKHGGLDYVVLTDRTGANRVYESGGETFARLTETSVTSAGGQEWRLTEAALLGPNEKRLKRLAAHRAFWFGWHAAYPETELIDKLTRARAPKNADK